MNPVKDTSRLHEYLRQAKAKHKQACLKGDLAKRQEAMAEIRKWKRHIEFYEKDLR